jgi:hypothetical protein
MTLGRISRSAAQRTGVHVSRGGWKRFTPGRLRRLFEAYPSPAVPAGYGQRIGALRFPAIRGFLKGFMDLVFEYEGRWYLADYKSNHLGDGFGDYGADALSREMADHHYYLQYHLYLAAHRYPAYRCRIRLRHPFRRGHYLFIRGMSKETGMFGVSTGRGGDGGGVAEVSRSSEQKKSRKRSRNPKTIKIRMTKIKQKTKK